MINKKKLENPKTIINVGYCESNSEWLKRVISELADESKNFIDFSILCY